MKVGRSVSADLRRIADKWSLHELHEQLTDANAEHIIELGVLAKMKGLVSDARVSLGALTGICLHHSLQKTNSLHLSHVGLSLHSVKSSIFMLQGMLMLFFAFGSIWLQKPLLGFLSPISQVGCMWIFVVAGALLLKVRFLRSDSYTP